MILVSACLAGVNCSWDGKNRLDEETSKPRTKFHALSESV